MINILKYASRNLLENYINLYIYNFSNITYFVVFKGYYLNILLCMKCYKAYKYTSLSQYYYWST
jgi:hypothetical protein